MTALSPASSVTLWLPPALKARLQADAAADGTSVEALINRHLSHHVDTDNCQTIPVLPPLTAERTALTIDMESQLFAGALQAYDVTTDISTIVIRAVYRYYDTADTSLSLQKKTFFLPADMADDLNRQSKAANTSLTIYLLRLLAEESLNPKTPPFTPRPRDNSDKGFVVSISTQFSRHLSADGSALLYAALRRLQGDTGVAAPTPPPERAIVTPASRKRGRALRL